MLGCSTTKWNICKYITNY